MIAFTLVPARVASILVAQGVIGIVEPDCGAGTGTLTRPSSTGYTPRMLLCTVRDCREQLLREERRMVCPRGHSFDIARRGYVNLLQPQDRRSKKPGDTSGRHRRSPATA